MIIAPRYFLGRTVVTPERVQYQWRLMWKAAVLELSVRVTAGLNSLVRAHGVARSRGCGEAVRLRAVPHHLYCMRMAQPGLCSLVPARQPALARRKAATASGHSTRDSAHQFFTSSRRRAMP